mmetsp:Transcript_52231/g.167429  ORF Transcript_52231/g.167429 Transcript_52231/m.167429 type:complete len:262 (+) Transcript_52231:106-891(+)
MARHLLLDLRDVHCSSAGVVHPHMITLFALATRPVVIRVPLFGQQLLDGHLDEVWLRVVEDVVVLVDIYEPHCLRVLEVSLGVQGLLRRGPADDEAMAAPVVKLTTPLALQDPSDAQGVPARTVRPGGRLLGLQRTTRGLFANRLLPEPDLAPLAPARLPDGPVVCQLAHKGLPQPQSPLLRVLRLTDLGRLNGAQHHPVLLRILHGRRGAGALHRLAGNDRAGLGVAWGVPRRGLLSFALVASTKRNLLACSCPAGRGGT